MNTDDESTQDAAKTAAIKPKTEAVESRMADLMPESGIDRAKVKTLLRRATGNRLPQAQKDAETKATPDSAARAAAKEPQATSNATGNLDSHGPAATGNAIAGLPFDFDELRRRGDLYLAEADMAAAKAAQESEAKLRKL